MNYFNKEQIEKFSQHSFQFLEVKHDNNNFIITLNRPEQKNALHPKMVDELAFAFQYAYETHSVWNIIIRAKGDVFCAGADLKAFRGELGEVTSTIPIANGQILIANLFKEVYKPVLVLVHADVFAGGTFFVAGATEVIAVKNINIHLSEVKRGIFPFQVMAALSEVINPKKALRWSVLGETWSAKKAFKNGLIHTLVENENDLEAKAKEWIDTIALNSPKAIQLGLEAYNNYSESDNPQKYLLSMLHKSLETKDSKEGIQAFKEKRKPNWMGK